ncbi:hypothetical protein CBW65_13000 [Tumebacillus avium]|uniref:Uncharacterized protein n=1 Tax=Tumebacillus avium TaxID=1903704 RepID=A0A1Y0IQX6_9BACL|nr:hypothetical protein [Tumebacillus avium]ARU61845.1 hypothetical protein CBW65_13000 [Tumebacillus avium]
MTYQATIHIQPRGERAMQVATAHVTFLNGGMQLYEIETLDGMQWEGPVEADEMGRMLESAYLVLLEDGRKYRVAAQEFSDKWYTQRLQS